MTETGELDLREARALSLGEASLSIHDTEIALTTTSSETLRTYVDDFGSSIYAAFWTDGKRVVLVGLTLSKVVLGDPEAGWLGVVGQLRRLDLSNSYDPGGLHYVRFVDLSDTRLLIIYELGLAVVDLVSRMIIWQRQHDDLTIRFTGIVESRAWFEGERGRIGFRLEDGARK